MRNNTITDIARKLGISTSTVSRALNNHPDISDETKIKVRVIAQQMNYSPNPIARSLKKNTTCTIGIIVPEIMHDFFSSAISGIEEVAYRSGFTIIVSQSNESFEREVINTTALMNHRVAGLIVSISQQTRSGEHFQLLIDRNIPLVFFDRVYGKIHANKVVIDDEKSAYIAVKHLIDRGYKNIAHFTGPEELDICKKRLMGYKKAIENSGIKLDEKLIIYGGLHETDGYKSMEILLNKNFVNGAVFCINDPVAIGAFQKIKEAGFRIPQDFGLVGFSNNKITSLIDPPLTTVDQPSFEMGKKAAEILIDLIENPGRQSEPETVVLNTNLIIRGST
jgi:DNA-binding LacI/PurR family transcriptional regulator